MSVGVIIVFFFKQKTAYEMRISDWSSDVCSSDLLARMPDRPVADPLAGGRDAGRAALDGGGPGGETEPMRLSDHRVSRNPAKLFGDKIGRVSCRERVCQVV